MKQVIEELEQAKRLLDNIYGMTLLDYKKKSAVKTHINAALSLLQAPRRETPEQREKRTGKKWPDDWAVYTRWRDKGVYTRWSACGHEDAKISSFVDPKDIICATEAGPPPDDWEPEEE